VSVFVDTSALYALLVESELDHRRVATTFRRCLADGRDLATSNYVLLECCALLQSRIGIEAVRDLCDRIAPLLRTLWVGEEQHRLAAARLLGAGKRGISLVDWSSFVLMEAEGIRDAFALDRHFRDAGFRLLAAK